MIFVGQMRFMYLPCEVGRCSWAGCSLFATTRPWQGPIYPPLPCGECPKVAEKCRLSPYFVADISRACQPAKKIWARPELLARRPAPLKDSQKPRFQVQPISQPIFVVTAAPGRYCCKSPRGEARPGKFGNNRIRIA